MNTKPQVRHITKLVREGELAADVEVRVVERDDLFDGGSYLPPEEAKKLDAVRRALRAGDTRTASRLARRVYALRPVGSMNEREKDEEIMSAGTPEDMAAHEES